MLSAHLPAGSGADDSELEQASTSAAPEAVRCVPPESQMLSLISAPCHGPCCLVPPASAVAAAAAACCQPCLASHLQAHPRRWPRHAHSGGQPHRAAV